MLCGMSGFSVRIETKGEQQGQEKRGSFVRKNGGEEYLGIEEKKKKKDQVTGLGPVSG